MYRDRFGEFVCGYWGLKGKLMLFGSSLLQMGFAEECPPGTSVAGNTGKEIAHLEPTRCLQVVYDYGNQPKGILLIL